MVRRKGRHRGETTCCIEYRQFSVVEKSVHATGRCIPEITYVAGKHVVMRVQEQAGITCVGVSIYGKVQRQSD